MTTIDLNADVGEGAGFDDQLIPLLSSANIACGAHAGDDSTMQQGVAMAVAGGVVVGAHPGFPDRKHFGRQEVNLSPEDLQDTLQAQLLALHQHGQFAYVKPHGALYNLAARDAEIAQLVVKCVQAFDASLGLLALANSELQRAGERSGLRVAAEAFVDRRYDAAGRLVSRSVAGAVIHDAAEAVSQAVDLVCENRVTALTGERIVITPDSLCVHGDTPGAVEFVRRLRSALENQGVEVKSFWAAG